MALPARGVLEAASPALATVLRDDFVAAYERELPAVAQCFHDHFDACIAHLRFSLRHRRVIRTTNLLERPFLEERRRTKIIPHAFGERPVVKLIYAAFIRADDRWRGLSVGEFEQRELRAIREELDRAHAERTRPAVRQIRARAVEVIQQGPDLTGQELRTQLPIARSDRIDSFGNHKITVVMMTREARARVSVASQLLCDQGVATCNRILSY